jgi:hypothetical protein
MKKISFLPLLALVLAVAASAFTVKAPFKSKSLQTLHYYRVSGSTIGSYLGDFDLTQSADRQAIEDESGCNNSATVVCAKGFSQLNPTDASTGTAPWNERQ